MPNTTKDREDLPSGTFRWRILIDGLVMAQVVATTREIAERKFFAAGVITNGTVTVEKIL